MRGQSWSVTLTPLIPLLARLISTQPELTICSLFGGQKWPDIETVYFPFKAAVILFVFEIIQCRPGVLLWRFMRKEPFWLMTPVQVRTCVPEIT